MKALITGGAGFIGSNIVKLLLEKNFEVRVFDNLSSGYANNLDNLSIEFIKGDITDAQETEKACIGCDLVFHLAASVGRQRSLVNPQLDSNINVIGTINILEGMRKNNIKRIIYSSSAAIFGELMTPVINESHPQNADSPYGISKLAAEKMILVYNDIYKMNGICLRYFNVYGVNQKYDFYGNVIPVFAKCLYANEPITIFGDGLQTRDFLNVKDIAKANYIAAVSDIAGGVFNVGSGTSITINELARQMQLASNIHNGIVYAPERPADVKHCKADISLINNKLGFKADVEFSNGICEYLSWYKNNCCEH